MSTPDPPNKGRKVRVAAAQIAPVYHDLPAATARAVETMAQAARQGVELLVFPETWLSGYP